MLTGIRLRANPTLSQKRVLSQWMGCARVIWNAKVDEERYYRTFARKYYPNGTYAPLDQTTAQFKDPELTPWLSGCPSQILRNSAVTWHSTCQKFLKGVCRRPKRKAKTDCASIHLTREVFRFGHCSDGNIRLFIGTKTNNTGYLSFKAHAGFNVPDSLYICKERGQYYVSFCYDNGAPQTPANDEHLAFLQGADYDWLNEHTIGIDRGVAVPVHAGFAEFDYNASQKGRMERAQRYIKRLQHRLARQKKGSNRRNCIKMRLSRQYGKVANIRHDFAHQSSRRIVNAGKVFIFGALKTQRMTRKPKAKQDDNGRFLPNKAKAKAGLNKAILNAGWHRIETYTQYKASQDGKACFRIPAPYTSQECAVCGHTHPGNRKTQAAFICGDCGHTDNADNNASRVIKKRAINLILDTGTVLRDGVLTARTGRQTGVSKTKAGKARFRSRLPVKKEELWDNRSSEALPL
jgi:putative transposase